MRFIHCCCATQGARRSFGFLPDTSAISPIRSTQFRNQCLRPIISHANQQCSPSDREQSFIYLSQLIFRYTKCAVPSYELRMAWCFLNGRQQSPNMHLKRGHDMAHDARTLPRRIPHLGFLPSRRLVVPRWFRLVALCSSSSCSSTDWICSIDSQGTLLSQRLWHMPG